MKAVAKISFVLVLVGFFSAFPQKDTVKKDALSLERWKIALSENDEFLHAIEVMDKDVIENAKVLIHNMQTKKAVFYELAKYQSNEIGRNLASSEDYLTMLQKRTDIAMDEIQVAYYAGLHKHYKKAIEESRALQDELIKVTPVTSVIVMNALGIYAEISKAENEQIELQNKMEIKEPGVPVQQK